MLRSTIFFFFLLFTIGHSQVTITIGGQNVPDDSIHSITEGSDLALRCTTADSGAAITIAQHPPNTVTIVPESSNTDTNGTFTISNVQRDIQGLKIQCLDGSDDVTFTIDVQYSPSISNLVNGTGPEGGSANVTFTVDANPAVTKSGITVPSKPPDDTIVNTNGSTSYVTLVYDELERSDDGQFILHLNNSISPVLMKSFELNVFFGPDFISNGGSLQVDEGQPLEIDCSVGDSNPPVIQSVTVSGYEIAQPVTLPNDNRIYEVVEMVTLAYNNTTFTCTASNGETMSTLTFIVTVIKGPTESPTMGPTESPTDMTDSLTGTTGSTTDAGTVDLQGLSDVKPTDEGHYL